MSDSIRRQMELFEAAIDLPPEQREAFLRQECGQNTRLLEAIRRQIAKAAEPEPPETPDDPIIGSTVGPYRVKSLLGEGGYGSVYLAERQAPMVQQVALKIIRAGRDSKSVLARFDQERQALALMDHPNIAKVFDAGSTPDGRPYFVMEYVAGEPITEYCDSNRLTVSQRLELFISVCEAVQHAHQKAIIHRDLKPRNILVSRVDSKPVAKVIDFGIAKATGERLIDQTIETMQGIAVGTLLYMSPEQADGGKQDVDTRSDVYSLGVVLYELLAGILPHDAETLLAAGQAEMHRIIREVDPPSPSTRLETIDGQTGTAIGTARGEDRSKLAGRLRRELEWIPMMALRKDRARRYGSAAAMATEVRRYLEGKPLAAAPESRAYLVRKFVRRNRLQVGAAGAIAAVLVVATGVSVWFGVAERERADQLKQVSDFQSKMLSQIDTTTAGINLMKDIRERFVAALEKTRVPEEERTRRVESLRQELVRVNATDAAAAMIDRTILKPAVRTIDEQFKDQPVVDAQLRQALSDLYRSIGLYDQALPLQESALSTRHSALGEEHHETLASIHRMGVLLQARGNLAQAEPYCREALEKRRRVLGNEHPDTLTSISNMGLLLQAKGKLGEAEAYYREALETSERVLGHEHPDTLACLSNVGFVLTALGKLAEAEPYWVDAMTKSRRVLGEEHTSTLSFISNMAMLLKAQGKLGEAEPYFSEALEKRRRVLGEEHPDTLSSINNMGFLLLSQGRLTEAEPYHREALEKSLRVLGEQHPKTITCLSNMGFLLQERGANSEAEAYQRRALSMSRSVLGEDHPSTLLTLNNLGGLLHYQDKLAEAEPLWRDVLEKRRRLLGEEHPDTLRSINNMGSLLRAQGKLAEAEPHYRDALEKSRRLLGEEHPNTLTFTINMGGLLQAQGKHQEALDLLARIEPAARKRFTDGNARRLADFLTALGRARLGVGFDAERFAVAESNLLEAHPIYLAAKDRGPTHKDTLECVQALIDLYTAWDKAEPGKGYDTKAAEWQAKLDGAKAAATTPASPPPKAEPTGPNR